LQLKGLTFIIIMMNKIVEPNIEPQTMEFLLAQVAKGKWRKAKSENYPPELMHEYIMFMWDTPVVNALAHAIDVHGYEDDFFGQPHRYLILGEYKYWYYMNKEKTQVTIINREDKYLGQKRYELAQQKKSEKEKKKDEQPNLF